MGRKPPKIADPPADGMDAPRPGAGPEGSASGPVEPPTGTAPLMQAPDREPSAETARSLQELESELASAQAQIADLNQRWLRSAADLENYRRRAERERGEIRRQAESSILRSLLPVLDNFERALEVDPSASPEAFREGIELIAKLLNDTLSRLGVSAIPALGQTFDPEVHEAVEQRPDESPAGTVIVEHQKGYRLGDRLLRPAQVTVSRGLDRGGIQEAAGEVELPDGPPESEPE